MVAKFLLPSFGGSAGVWATCLAAFQVLLLGGYAYAHWLTRSLKPVTQRVLHLGVLVLAVSFFPVAPPVPSDSLILHAPAWALVRALACSVGLPFLVLSATAPLLMEWFRQSRPGRVPYRLYAFSNGGSLLALLLYPAFFEPIFDRHSQAGLWRGGLFAFLILCAITAWKSRHATATRAEPRPGYHANHKPISATPRFSLWLWIALPACGSALLLALTNQICQDVTPVPLLWVAPMGVYLLTFILCFEGPRSYRRGLFLPACLLAMLALAWLFYYGCLQTFAVQIFGYLAVLFIGCMVCHGELYRLRPGPERLTSYYLWIALGGALGGLFVAMLAPLIFNNVFETPLIAALLASLVTLLLWREGARFRLGKQALPSGRVALAGTLVIMASLAIAIHARGRQTIYSTRSFYGVCQVKEGSTWLINNVPCPLAYGRGRMLVSGQVYHGFQFLDPAASSFPTTYYSPESGLSLALESLPVVTNRYIGAIGLGTGTLAAYGRPGDRIRFYELNPDVIRIARGYFTFLGHSAAQTELVLGDGRLSLEREPNERFDLLVLDAFSGDSIPTHLLTDEAMRVYLRHLGPDGVIAVHVSNDHLDLQPVIRALAAQNGLRSLLVPAANLDPSTGKLGAVWMLLSASDAFFRTPIIAQSIARPTQQDEGKSLLWTDDHSSILPILR